MKYGKPTQNIYYSLNQKRSLELKQGRIIFLALQAQC